MGLEQIDSKPVITLGPSDSVTRAFKLMEDYDIRHLPIIEGEKVVGIVSDRDLLVIVHWISAWNSLNKETTGVGRKRVAELMSSPVSVLAPGDTVEEAARLMLQQRIGAVPLVQDGSIVSIVTEIDILRCYLADSDQHSSRPWSDLAVAEHMSDAVVTAKPTDHVMPTFSLMREKKIRHLPIVDEGKLVGLISDRDLRRSYGREIAINLARDEPVSQTPYRSTLESAMTRTVESIDRLATLADAASRMINCKIGGLPVTEQGNLLGMVTETDLLRVFVAHGDG